MNIGQQVKVTSSRHLDVLAGTVGIVKCEFEGGYGVTIEGDWLIAGEDRGMTIHETRTIWYPPEELNVVSKGIKGLYDNNGHSDKKRS